jgi:hypothetical protein
MRKRTVHKRRLQQRGDSSASSADSASDSD